MLKLFSKLARLLSNKPTKRQTPFKVNDGDVDSILPPVAFRLNDLPPELILYIARLLPLQSASALALTSQSYYDVCYTLLRRELLLTPHTRAAICARLAAFRDKRRDEPHARFVDKLHLTTRLMIQAHGESSWDSDIMASAFGEVLRGLPLLKEVKKLGGGLAGSSALNALCQLVGDNLESLAIPWEIGPERPLDPALLPFPRLTTLELTCIAWTYSAFPIPTELAQAFPALRRLTLRCTPRYLHVDDFFATCTFASLSHFALLCVPFLHDACAWTAGALAALPSFLVRHHATLTSLSIPPWDMEVVPERRPMLREVNVALSRSRICSLRARVLFAAAVTQSGIPLMDLRELHIGGVSMFAYEFLHDRNRTSVWPLAPNLRVLGITLVGKVEIDLKAISATYPLLEELHLDLRNVYVAYDIDKNFAHLSHHLRWICVRLSGRQVERYEVQRDGRHLVKLPVGSLLEFPSILD